MRVWYDDVSEVWVSWDPARDVHSQGITRDEAISALHEALGMLDRYAARRR